MKYLKRFNESTGIVDNKKRLVDELKKQYQLAIDVYKALFKEGGEKSILRRKKELENYFNENTHINLDSISRGSREISDSQNSPYYLGSILTYLYKSSFSASFFNMISGKSVTFDEWYESEKIEPIVNKISELSNSTKQTINESKGGLSKSDILKMSNEELEDTYGTLEVSGEYLGKRGKFHHFKKVMGNVVCSFRYDDITKSGLRRGTRGIKVRSEDVKFN